MKTCTNSVLYVPAVVGVDVGSVEPPLAPLQELEADGRHVPGEGPLVRPAEQHLFVESPTAFQHSN